jgi:predicted DNA-binding transcriptional regulator AlpA
VKTPNRNKIARKHSRPKPPPPIDGTQPINPDFFYRLHEGRKYFGYGPSTIEAKIQSGEIPAPISLSDSGRARGWFGRTIIAWQREREAAAAKAAAMKSTHKATT